MDNPYQTEQPMPRETIPARVQLAFRFVEMSNQFMSPKPIPLDDGDVEWYRPELPPAHELAFERACDVMTNYFDPCYFDGGEEDDDGGECLREDGEGDAEHLLPKVRNAPADSDGAGVGD